MNPPPEEIGIPDKLFLHSEQLHFIAIHRQHNQLFIHARSITHACST